MSGIVESCPANSTEITKASSNLNCSRDKYGNDQYICVPNVNKTALVEFCNNGIMGIVEKGNCLEVSEGELVKRSCTGFVEGCPEIHYGRNEIYRYPACQRINTDYKCYLADPSCPNKTRQFTTEDTWGSSTASFMTSFEFSNTTEKGVYTTLPTNAGSVGAIVGGLVAGVVIIGIGIVLTVIGFIVWKRRKKQRKKQRRTGNTEEAEVKLLAETENTQPPERRHSRPSDDDIGERQNLANLQNESGSLVNNAAGVSEFTLLLEPLTDEEIRHSLHVDDDIRERKNLGNQENGSEPLLNNAAVSDDDPPTLKREDKSTRDDGAMSIKKRTIQGRKMEVLGDYSVWKTEISGSPSGHAMVTSAVLYSIGTSFMKHGIKQAKAVERVLVWVSFTVVLVPVNVSRLFIATHFPHQVVAGSLTGILLAEVVKHEHTSGLTFKHYAIWCIVLVIGVCATYFGISILSLDPLWSLTLAKKWCANPEWVHPDTTPFFTFTRDVSSLLGFGAGISLRDKMKTTVDIGMGQKLVYVTLSLTLTMVVENFKIPSTSPVFYVIGFVKFNIMMIGIAFVIPYLVFTNKKKKN